MYKTGFIVGKFYPPHRGHKYLIDTGRSMVEHLTVMLVGRPEETIPPSLRATWLREIHPDVTVIEVDDLYGPDDSEGWARFTKQTLGYTPDVVFTSEKYGDPFSFYLGCKHIQVDLNRQTYPCSGTFVRNNPFTAWNCLEPCVRAYFARRICVLGAESTGTTTMSRALAEYYHTVWVPEYGREYCERKFAGMTLDEIITESRWESAEFIHIAHTQCEDEDSAAREANKLLICDTNAFATNIWHERYMGALSDEIAEIAEQRRYAMTFLTDVDIPFEQDGSRDGETIRHNMHRRFVEELTAHSVPFETLSGPHSERLQKAVSVIDKLF